MPSVKLEKLASLGPMAVCALLGYGYVDPALEHMGIILSDPAVGFATGLTVNFAAQHVSSGWKSCCRKLLAPSASARSPFMVTAHDALLDAITTTQNAVSPVGTKESRFRRSARPSLDQPAQEFYDRMRTNVERSKRELSNGESVTSALNELENGPLHAWSLYDAFLLDASKDDFDIQRNLLGIVRTKLFVAFRDALNARIWKDDPAGTAAWREYLISVVEDLGEKSRFSNEQTIASVRDALAFFEDAASSHHSIAAKLDELQSSFASAIAQQHRQTVEAIEHNIALSSNFLLVSSQIERDREFLEAHPADKVAYYSGTQPRWMDVLADFDAPRKITWEVIDFVVRHAREPNGTPIGVVRAISGEGKTTISMRAAIELVELGFHVLWFDGRQLNAQELDSASKHAPVVAFIDDAHKFDEMDVESFLTTLGQRNARVTLILVVRDDIWSGKELDSIRASNNVEDFVVGPLCDEEIDALLQKLESAKSLGKLAGVSPAQRRQHFKDNSHGQLLVAMLEAVQGEAFENIVQRSIKELESAYPMQPVRLACEIVSAVNAFGVSVSRERLQRILGVQSIDADILAKTRGTLVAPVDEDGRLRMRHSVFAATVFRQDPGRYDRLQKFIEASDFREANQNESFEDDLLQLLIAFHRQFTSLRLVKNKVETLFETALRHHSNMSLVHRLWARFRNSLGDYSGAREHYQIASSGSAIYPEIYYEWALFERSQANLEEARRLFKAATEAAPARANAWYEWALLERDQANPDEARRLFKTATEVATANFSCWSIWAHFERDQANPDEARRLFKAVTEVAPANADGWVHWAHFERNQSNPDEARRLFKTATDITPASAEALVQFALFERDQSNPDEARRLFKTATDITPASAEALVQFALFERDQSNPDEARRLFKTATDITPASAEALVQFALFERDQSNPDEARRLSKTATEIFPNNARTWSDWAHFEEDQHNYDEAARLYKTTLDIAPGRKEVSVRWANMERKRGDVSKSRDIFRELSKSSPEYSSGLRAWAMLEQEQGDFPRARELFQQATQASPRYSHAWRSWGIFEKEQGNIPRARELLNKALQVNPKGDVTQQAWAILEKEQGDIPRARKLFQKATRSNPKNAATWQAWAILEKEQANIPLARDLFLKATQVDPRSAPARQAWAILEKEQGDIPRARDLFLEATRSDPRSAPAWQAWAILEKEQGDIPRARDLFLKATQSDPRNAAIWQAWGLMELERGEEIKALSLVQESLRLAPDNPQNLLARARVYAKSGDSLERLDDLQLARDLLETAQTKLPRSVRIATLLIEALIELEEWSLAKAQIRSALQFAQPGELHYVYERLGDLAFATGDFKVAEAAWNKVLDLMPQYVAVIDKLSRVSNGSKPSKDWDKSD